MKQGRKLTRAEKVLLHKMDLKVDDWQFLDDCRDPSGRVTAYFKIINKNNKTIKVIDRFWSGRGKKK